jgi:mRNA interferase YafQ
MLNPVKSGPFKKDAQLMKRRGKNMGKLREIIDLITAEQPLPPRCRNHALHGEWEGSFDCHILGDWVLIYEPDTAAKTVTFHRTGTHSDLF